MRRLLVMGVVAVVMAGCGGSAPANDTATAPATGGTPASPADEAAKGVSEMAKGMEQAANAFQQMAQSAAKPVAFEQLTAVLVDVPGWTRSEPRGEQMTAPIAHSQAEARYHQGESQVAITIQDTALSKMFLAPFTMFLVKGYEERSSDGFKRYAEFGGEPGFEEWNTRDRVGEVTVIIGQRLILNARGTDVATLDPVKAVVGRLDMNRLKTLAATK